MREDIVHYVKVKIKLLPPKQSEVRQKQHSADDNSYKEHLLK